MLANFTSRTEILLARHLCIRETMPTHTALFAPQLSPSQNIQYIEYCLLLYTAVNNFVDCGFVAPCYKILTSSLSSCCWLLCKSAQEGPVQLPISSADWNWYSRSFSFKQGRKGNHMVQNQMSVEGVAKGDLLFCQFHLDKRRAMCRGVVMEQQPVLYVTKLRTLTMNWVA